MMSRPHPTFARTLTAALFVGALGASVWYATGSTSQQAQASVELDVRSDGSWRAYDEQHGYVARIGACAGVF